MKLRLRSLRGPCFLYSASVSSSQGLDTAASQKTVAQMLILSSLLLVQRVMELPGCPLYLSFSSHPKCEVEKPGGCFNLHQLVCVLGEPSASWDLLAYIALWLSPFQLPLPPAPAVHNPYEELQGEGRERDFLNCPV